MRIDSGTRSWTWELRPPRVLIAEGNDHTRAALVTALRADGYETVEATDGDQILDTLLAFPPGPQDCIDVVIAGQRLAGCPGPEVLERLRGMQIRTPFVVVGEASQSSSSSSTRDRVQCREDVTEIRGAVFALTHDFSTRQ